MWVQFLIWGDLLEESMATHFSILDGRIPWIEEPGVLCSPWCRKGLDVPEATQHAHGHISFFLSFFFFQDTATSASLNFCLSGNVLIYLEFLKYSFAEYRILGRKFFLPGF